MPQLPSVLIGFDAAEVEEVLEEVVDVDLVEVLVVLDPLLDEFTEVDDLSEDVVDFSEVEEVEEVEDFLLEDDDCVLEDPALAELEDELELEVPHVPEAG